MSSPRPRRSFAQLGGAITTRGEPALAELLGRAWREAEGPSRELTHGFHPYPARTPPRMAAALVAALSRTRDLVVDPFCGSGTVLVEAFAAGRRAIGVDVNGVAVRVARLKTARLAAPARAALVTAAERIARRALARARGRDPEGDAAPPPAELRGWFAPHVWRELDALGRAVDEVADPARHAALLLVLSSLLTKVSLRRAETSEERVDKALAPGFTARAFAARARELAEGLAELDAEASRGTPAPVVLLADARALPIATGAARLVVTSPPYLGTYDYAEVQRLRARLFSIPLAAAERHELGARAAANAAPSEAIARFRADLAAALSEVRRVLAPDGAAVVVIGDSSARDRRVRADELVEQAAAASALRVVALATQRHEHAIALQPSGRSG